MRRVLFRLGLRTGLGGGVCVSEMDRVRLIYSRLLERSAEYEEPTLDVKKLELSGIITSKQSQR